MSNQELTIFKKTMNTLFGKKQQKNEIALAIKLQETIQKLQSKNTRSNLDIALENKRHDAAKKVMQKDAGLTAKQVGIAKAVANKNPQVEAARRIARTLAANGPISIDDVTNELIKQGYETAYVKPGDRPHVWKGSIFRTSEWVCVGEENARLARSHARPNKMWALKSWLQTHSMNGRKMRVSRFDIEGIRRDFEKYNPGLAKDHCQWFIGESALADDVKLDIVQAKNTYGGVPVTFVDNAVGALVQFAPPLIKNQQLVKNQPIVELTTYNSNT